MPLADACVAWRRVALAAVALTAVACILGSPAAASPPGTNGIIAFEVTGLQRGIYAEPATGGTPTVLIASQDSCPFGAMFPAWKPDGSQLAFSGASCDGHDQDVWTAAPDGTHLRQLTHLDGSQAPLAYDPQGRRLAVRTCPDGNSCELGIVKASGKNLRVLTDLGGVVESAAWSPDGTTIAFVVGPPPFSTDPTVLYFIHPDGTGLVAAGHNVLSVDWSPDGSHLVLDTSRGVVVTDADGSGGVTLAKKGSRPVWSPDGTEIAYFQPVKGQPVAQLVERHPDGSGRQVLGMLPPQTIPVAVSWQPLPAG